MKNEFKCSVETAQNELDKLFDYYEIDFDDQPTKQRDNIDAVNKKLIKFIRLGRLKINDEDGLTCEQTLRNVSTTIVYRELNGKAKTAMGTKSEVDGNGRLYALMGALSDGEEAILKLKGPDISLVECLAAVFMMV